MNHCLKVCIARWIAGSVIASMLAMSVLFLSSTPTFATACNGADMPAAGATSVCTMNVVVGVTGGGLTLANDAAAAVSNAGSFPLTGSAITGTFNFSSTVKDHEDNTTGWQLSASSSGFLYNATTTPFVGSLSLTGEDSGSPTPSCTNGSCAVTATYATGTIPLSSTPAPFLSASGVSTTTIVDGTYTYKTDGTFSIPATAAHIGTYTASVALYLTDTF